MIPVINMTCYKECGNKTVFGTCGRTAPCVDGIRYGKTIEKCPDSVKLFFKGYDAAVKDMLNLLDNLDVYEGLETIFSEGIADVTGDKVERMKKAMSDWADMSKNEVLVAFCDKHEIETDYMTWSDFAEAKED